MKNTAIKKLISAVLAFVLLLMSVGCKKQPVISADISKSETVITDTANSILTYENQDGVLLYSFVIPKSLFVGGEETEDLVTQFNDISYTVLLETGEEVPIKECYYDIYANEDGTTTFVFTAEQLELYLQETRAVASLYRFVNKNGCAYVNGTAIISTEFTDDDLTEVAVYVDGGRYPSKGLDTAIIEAGAGFMGLYQVMSGVNPYEWHVDVTVKDYETGEVIAEASYPND